MSHATVTDQELNLMGLVRFQVHPPSRITPRLLERAYLAGIDQVPWQTKARRSAEGFVLERDESDSGYAHVPWTVPGHGELTLVTGTLMERERPYDLLVELARGKINRLREQAAVWQSIGLVIPPPLVQQIKQAHTAFARAATSQNDPAAAAQHAEAALSAALTAAAALAGCYAQQGLSARRRQTPKLDVLLGVALDHAAIDTPTASAVQGTFNSVHLGLNWLDAETGEGQYDFSVYDRQAAWCRSACMTVIGGPLLQLDRHGLPDWLCLWEGDFDNVLSFVESHVRTTVERYKGHVNCWLCAARISSGDALSLSEEERLRVVVQAFETTRQIDPNTPTLVRIDQPWSEFLSQEEAGFSPFQLADTLARAELGLAGVDLEVNVGYDSVGSYRRDLLDFSRLVDLWSLLGLPLFITLSCPSSNEPDPRARARTNPRAEACDGGWSAEAQRDWVESLVGLLLAKPIVRGITWSQLRDSEPHELPHAGLIDPAGRPKPTHAALAALRKAHLK